MFTALSEKFGEMQDKINLFVALAPIIHLHGSHNKFLYTLSKSVPLARKILNALNIHEFFGPSWNTISDQFCLVFDDLCDSVSIRDVPYNDYNNPIAARIANKRPQSSSSVKQVLHYA